MEPVTIAGISLAAFGASQTAWRVGNDLYEFIHSTRNVDETISRLQSEVKQVEGICQLVDKQIKSLPQAGSGDEDLLKGINSQIVSCTAPIQKIESKMERVNHQRKSFFKQTRTQMRLNMNQKDIDECRRDIQASVLNLQLSVQLVNLQAIFIAPNVANETLLEKLDELRRLLVVQGSSLNTEIRNCATTYIAKGTSLYASSLDASSVAEKQQDPTDSTVAQWLGQLQGLRFDRSEKIEKSPSLGISHNSPQSRVDHTRQSLEASLEYFLPEILQETLQDEVELDFEFTHAAIASGKAAYIVGDYAKAEAIFKEVLAEIKSLPMHMRQYYDLNEIHLMLAMATTRTSGLAATEAALVSALSESSDLHAELRLEAGTALTMLYIRRRKYALARSTGQNVYRGYQKLRGNDDAMTVNSLALLARIFGLLNLSAHRESCLSLIPTDQQEEARVRYKQLPWNPCLRANLEEQKTRRIMKQSVNLIQTYGGPKLNQDGSLLALPSFGLTSDFKGYIQLWHIQTGSRLHVLSFKNNTAALAVSFSRCGGKLISGHGGLWKVEPKHESQPLNLLVWNALTGDLLCQIWVSNQTNLQMQSLMCLPKGEDLIVTYDYIKNLPESDKTGKLKPGFMILNATEANTEQEVSVDKTAKPIYQREGEACWFRSVSEDCARMSIQIGEDMIVHSLDNYSLVVEISNDLRGGLLRADGSMISGSPHGDLVVQRNGRQFFYDLKVRITEQLFISGARCITSAGDIIAALRAGDSKSLYLILYAPELIMWKQLVAKAGTCIKDFSLASNTKSLVYLELDIDSKQRLVIVDVWKQLASGANTVYDPYKPNENLAGVWSTDS